MVPLVVSVVSRVFKTEQEVETVQFGAHTGNTSVAVQMFDVNTLNTMSLKSSFILESETF